MSQLARPPHPRRYKMGALNKTIKYAIIIEDIGKNLHTGCTVFVRYYLSFGVVRNLFCIILVF